MRRFAATLVAASLVLSLGSAVGPAAAQPDSPEASASASPGHPEAPGAAAPVLEEAHELLSGEAAGDSAAPVERDATLVLRDVWLARPQMTRDERRRADALLARPTVPGTDSYATYRPGTPTERTCSDRVCVTYVTSTADRATPEWAARVLATVESAWTREVDELGYRAPAPDGDAGGDPRFDVYLANISSKGLYGYCVPEDTLPGQPSRAQAYCVLDNDMAGFSMDPVSSLAVTAAHEFFHAVQFNIDAREDQWFMEASATWIEELVADHVNDNRQFLKSGQLGTPALPLDSYSSDMAMYGNWIFVQWLAQSFGVDAIRKIWVRLDATKGAPNQYSVQGIRNFVGSQGVRWGRFYSRFVEANLQPWRHYEEGRKYRRAPLSQRVRMNARRPVRRFSPAVSHLSSHTIMFKAAKGLPTKRRLAFRVKARKGRGATPVARLLVFKKRGKVTRVNVPLNRKGKGSRKVNFRRGKVKKVVLVLSNASTRYRNCGSGSIWACGGRPVDDGQGFDVRVRLIR